MTNYDWHIKIFLILYIFSLEELKFTLSCYIFIGFCNVSWNKNSHGTSA
jgi:hypothetical protein